MRDSFLVTGFHRLPYPVSPRHRRCLLGTLCYGAEFHRTRLVLELAEGSEAATEAVPFGNVIDDTSLGQVKQVE